MGCFRYGIRHANDLHQSQAMNVFTEQTLLPRDRFFCTEKDCACALSQVTFFYLFTELVLHGTHSAVNEPALSAGVEVGVLNAAERAYVAWRAGIIAD